jgi:circadian clock protein KaiC
MTTAGAHGSLDRLPTGIPGFEQISHGGLPKGRSTLVVGTAGSGKTVYGAQYITAGAREHGDGGVIVTFDESPEAVVRNLDAFGWGLPELIDTGKIAFVDCSPSPDEDAVEMGDFDFHALLARIRAALERVGGQRVLLDSVTALLPQFYSEGRVRRELSRVVHGLNDMGVTTVLTAERIDEYGAIARHGVEEFVSDAVVVLRNPLDEQRRRRTIEILKFRGGSHQSGEFPFTISAAEGGMSVIPLSAIELERPASTARVSLGNPGVDELFGGGVYRDSLILVSGPTGTGKTLMALSFIQAAIDAGEHALMFSFEESHNQLLRNASSWTQGMEEAERNGQVKIMSAYPERMGLEDLLQRVRREIDSFGPRRVAIDSLTALERVSTRRAFREFVVRTTSLFKENEIAALYTNTSSMISGGETITDAYVSTITDGIMLLRYAEIEGEIRRAAAVLKMRGSKHDKRVREYTITPNGIEVGHPIEGAHGLIVQQQRDGRPPPPPMYGE